MIREFFAEMKTDGSELLIVANKKEAPVFSVLVDFSKQNFKSREFTEDAVDALVRFTDVQVDREQDQEFAIPTIGQITEVEKNMDIEKVSSVFNGNACYWVENPKTGTKYIKNMESGALWTPRKEDKANLLVVRR